MIKKSKVFGMWWLPQTPDHKVRGYLTFSPRIGRFRLMAFGSLTGNEDTPRRGVCELPVIHGVSVGGVAISLCESFIPGAMRGKGGLSHEVVEVNEMVYGRAVASEGEPRYIKSQVRLEHLERWLGAVPYQLDMTNPGAWTYVETSGDEVPKVAASTPDGSVRVTSWLGREEGGGGWSTIRARSQVHLVISPDVPRNALWHQEMAHWVRMYFYLLFGVPTRLVELCLQDHDSKDGYPDVNLIYRQSYLRPRPRKEHLRTYHVQFKAGATEGLAVWLAHRSQLEHPVNLLAAGDFLSKGSVGRFLTYMNALEVWHRGRHDRTLMPPSEFRKALKSVRAAIPEGLPESVRERMCNQLAYSNEPTLRERLDELAVDMGTQPRRILRLDAECIKRMANTRNYYTHYSRGAEDALKGFKLTDGADRARAWLIALLLEFIGLDEETVATSLRRGSDTMHVATSPPPEKT